MYHNYQTGSAWSGWESLGGTFDQNLRPAIGPNKDGRLQVFATGFGTDLLTSWQTAANGVTWSAWASLGGSWN